MNTLLKRVVVGLAAAFAATSAASAADLAGVVIPPAPPVVVPAPVAAFDWAGIYVGTEVDYLVCGGFCWFNLKGHAGINFTPGRLLVGVEIGGGYWHNVGDAGWLMDASARAGIVLGRLVPYAKAGYTLYGGGGVENYLHLGGGVELGLGQSLSVFAGVTAERSLSGPPFYMGVEAGLNFHFGN